MATAKQTTIRFAPEDLAILDAVLERTGLFTRSDALRYIIRKFAESEGITVVPAKAKPKKR